MLGAGGAARAAVYALAGAAPTSRSGTARASGPSGWSPSSAAAWWSGPGAPRSSSTAPASASAPGDAAFKRLPLDADTFGVGSHVVDMVYRAGGTELLAEARRRGATGGHRAGDPGRAGRSVVRALDRQDGTARRDARSSRDTMNPPTSTGATAKKPVAGKPKRGNGVTSPSRRGGCGRVLTDVIVDLGLVEREAMDEAIEMAHSAGSAAERVLVSTGAITEDQLARAVAERFGLDHLDLQRLPRRARGGQARQPGRDQALPGRPGRVRRRPHAARGDGAIRRTCSPSTTSR